MAQRLLTLSLIFVAATFAASAQTTEPVDLDAVHRIREEALNNSKVMDHLFQLTDVVGHRLTNSPGFFAAADWIEKQTKEWGLASHQEKWGPFGRGWNFTKFSARMTEPTSATLIGAPLAWTPGTNGKVTGEAMVVNIQNEGDFEQYKGKLKGKFLLMGVGRDLAPPTDSLTTRYSEDQLRALVNPQPGRGGAAPGTNALNTGRGRGGRGGNGANGGGRGGNGGQNNFTNQLNEFLKDQGVVAVVRLGSGRSDAGNVFVQSGGSREKKDPLAPPTFAITPEQYNRIARLLDQDVPVKLELEVEAQFYDDTTDSVNVVAEIRGDTKPDEVVMIGAHLDSWHGGTGATDNAAGSAVMIEVLRVLKTLNLPLKRSVRMVLWGGEEQGLLGSRAYVTEHFSDRDMKLKGEHEKFSAYYNVDNGTGKIRGVYLQGNDRVRPIFQAWLEPFADLGATTLTIRNTTGTDHTNFDAVGLPGFQFIQDPMDYNSRTHHSTADVFDRVQREDMQQMVAIVASFVYHTANRDDLLPREPLPAPAPAAKGKGKGK